MQYGDLSLLFSFLESLRVAEVYCTCWLQSLMTNIEDTFHSSLGIASIDCQHFRFSFAEATELPGHLWHPRRLDQSVHADVKLTVLRKESNPVTAIGVLFLLAFSFKHGTLQDLLKLQQKLCCLHTNTVESRTLLATKVMSRSSEAYNRMDPQAST